MERTDDIRATLAQEISRKEEELNSLRRTLALLDTALAAAAEAHARSAAAHALSEASRVAAQAQNIENIAASAAAAVIPPVQASSKDAEPIPEPPKIPPVKEFKERRATPRAPGTSRARPVVEAAPSPVEPAPKATPVPEQIHQMMRTSPSGKYVNLKVWKAVQTLLFERAEKMSIEEIARELKAGGATLGESPVRTVATAVGYMNTKIFHVTKSNGKTLVGLMAVNN